MSDNTLRSRQYRKRSRLGEIWHRLKKNKGAMVGRLAQRLGISMDHVYCVGDETNDISMLTAAKEGFAPANCAQAVKDAGATIVADKNHDTLADVIAILDKYYA